MAMKLRVAGITLAVLALAAMPAMADAISVGDQVWLEEKNPTSRYSYNGRTGGEWLLKNDTNAQMTPFETFCLEYTENISTSRGTPIVPILFKVGDISDSAKNGGVGAVNNADPLDVMTKYIYYTYRTNRPPDWIGSDVQQAIWFIEQEIPGTIANPGTLGYPGLTDGAQKIWKYAAGIVPGTFDFGGFEVSVLNMQKCTGTGADEKCENAQDLIALQPVPEPASLLLLGSGLLGVAAWRRKRQQ